MWPVSGFPILLEKEREREILSTSRKNADAKNMTFGIQERNNTDEENTDSEDKNYPLRFLFQNEVNSNETVILNENSEDEDYHKC